MTDIQTWLDHGKTLADKTIPGPWVAEWVEDDDWHEIHGQPFDGMVCPQVATIEGGGETEAAFIADARTRLPQALAVIQAVLEIHQNHGGPCPTVQAIQTELERKEKRDDSYAMD